VRAVGQPLQPALQLLLPEFSLDGLVAPPGFSLARRTISGWTSRSSGGRPIATLLLVVVVVVVVVVVGSMAAYAIARLRFPGKGALVGATLLVAMFPATSLVSPLFNLWRQLWTTSASGSPTAPSRSTRRI